MEVKKKRIAIFRMGHLGDTVIAMPALWTIRKRFPDAHIVYLTQENQANSLAQGIEVLRDGIVYDETFSYRLGRHGVSKLEILKTLWRLRKLKIDLLVYIPSYRSHGQLDRDKKFFRLAGIKQIVGISGYYHTVHQPPGVPLPEVIHESDQLLAYLAQDGIPTPDDPYQLKHLGLSLEEKLFAKEWVDKNLSSSRRIRVGIGPGSKMPSKRWPIERFIELTKRLDQAFEIELIAFGSKSEREECATVCQATRHSYNAAGELSVRQSAAVFEHCDLYIGNDTGTMHLAASANVPCIGIFSARDWPKRWYPLGHGHIVLREPVECEGCMLEQCDKQNMCLDLITVDSVVESATRKLNAIVSKRDG